MQEKEITNIMNANAMFLKRYFSSFVKQKISVNTRQKIELKILWSALITIFIMSVLLFRLSEHGNDRIISHFCSNSMKKVQILIQTYFLINYLLNFHLINLKCISYEVGSSIGFPDPPRIKIFHSFVKYFSISINRLQKIGDLSIIFL